MDNMNIIGHFSEKSTAILPKKTAVSDSSHLIRQSRFINGLDDKNGSFSVKCLFIDKLSVLRNAAPYAGSDPSAVPFQALRNTRCNRPHEPAYPCNPPASSVLRAW